MTRRNVAWSDGSWTTEPVSTETVGEELLVEAAKGSDYDQAGLMLWVSNEQWIKAGVEVNDGVFCVGAVVTDGDSDWALAPVPEWGGHRVTIRASRSKDVVVLRARATGQAWRTIRVCRFEPRSAAQAGPFVCAPERAGFTVRFTRWAFTEPDEALHWSPPATDP
jgi:regulation of enolase protein 1 (concanavalin A-like superfamily)